MNKKEMNYILSILQGKASCDCVDWYSIVGYIELNNIAGYFFNKLKFLKIEMPDVIEKKLNLILQAQKKVGNILLDWKLALSKKLEEQNVNYAFINASALEKIKYYKSFYEYHKIPIAEEIYSEGESFVNEIEILVDYDNKEKIENILKKLNFRRGGWDNIGNKFCGFVQGDSILENSEAECKNFILELQNGAIDYIEVKISCLSKKSEKNEMFLQDINISKDGLRLLEKTKCFLFLLKRITKENDISLHLYNGISIGLNTFLDIYIFIEKSLVCYEKLFDDCVNLHCAEECYYALSKVIKVFSSLKRDKKLISFMNRIRPPQGLDD